MPSEVVEHLDIRVNIAQPHGTSQSVGKIQCEWKKSW